NGPGVRVAAAGVQEHLAADAGEGARRERGAGTERRSARGRVDGSPGVAGLCRNRVGCHCDGNSGVRGARCGLPRWTRYAAETARMMAAGMTPNRMIDGLARRGVGPR